MAPLTYGEPLTPVRGEGATLFDADGRSYVDAYNNVPVVGHAHPRVATAIADQARLLSTNLRYLHPRAIELAERFVASMPPDSGLDTVLFLNSGSEATDLAWRIATAVTGNTGALVTDFAYHGVTTATTAFSPEQWRGGWAPDHVERFPAPRGPGSHPGLATAIGRLAKRGHHPAALILDPTYTSDGILAPGSGYHRALSAAVRAGGCDGGGRRSAGRLRPGRRSPLVVCRCGTDAGHRHAGQADGQRLSGRGGHRSSRRRRSARCADRVLQHLRRRAGRCGRGDGGARRDRRRKADRARGRNGTRSARSNSRPVVTRCAGAGC